MAEEQSPSAQPTQNPLAYNPGDYFISGGKTYVYKTDDFNFGTGQLNYTWQEQPFSFKPEGGKQLVAPPTGLIAAATGYDFQTQAENEIGDLGNKVNIRSFAPVSRPPEGAGTLRYPLPGEGEGGISQDGDYVLFQFYDYAPPFRDRDGIGSGIDYNQAGEYTAAAGYKPIMLYMPEDISSGFKANWDGKNMSNLATDSLRAAGRTGTLNKLGGALEGAGNLIDKAGALAGAAAIQAATSKIAGDSLSYDDIFGGISGAILNPNTELLYGGTQLRNIQLSFKLVPRHQKESVEVSKIITQFNKTLLPSKSPGNGVFKINNKGTQLGFIGVPKLVKVSFMKGSGENTRLPRFKMCALTSSDINYTPDGTYATYLDGQPVAVGLQLSFQETKIVFSEEIANDSESIR
jgi:hypothetical protein